MLGGEYIISIIAIIAFIFGLTFTTIGIFCPPIGIIDNSILIALGELLTFVGGLLGIDMSTNAKIDKLQRDK